MQHHNIVSLSDFGTDIKFSESMRDMYLEPYFYRKYASAERIVYMGSTGCSLAIQKMGVDTIIQKANGETVCIEEKIERYPGYVRTNFFLETSRNRNGKVVDTWMHTTKSDYLLYAFAMETGGLDVYFLPFPALQAWFLATMSRYKEHTMSDGTTGRLVRIQDVLEAVPVKRYIISPDGHTTFLRASQKVSRRIA